MFHDHQLLARKTGLVNVLEQLCEFLELSDAQFALAQERYEGVGAWLAEADNPLLRTLSIYLQGSTALGTTVRPIGSNEHDVDLVAFMPNYAPPPPATVKKAIGDRLRENGHYRPLLEEKPRCWRLRYANEFHLDITPSIPNPACRNGGERVPDRTLSCWKATNPKGYKARFERRALLVPRLRMTKGTGLVERGMSADIEPFPAAGGFKGPLRRIVQIDKRHRDVYFASQEAGLAPISVIITTLAAWSYEYCVINFVYDSELDLLLDVVRRMPDFIQVQDVGGQPNWFVWNETTEGENFAEKWNDDPRLAQAFYTWHRQLVADLDGLANVAGLDQLTKSLSRSFGRAPAAAVMNRMTTKVSSARRAGALTVAPVIGLGGGAAAATPVRANTFFGAL